MGDRRPPVFGEQRIDADGVIWVWVPSHHTVADELAIRAAGENYWPERLQANSSDAEKRAHGEVFKRSEDAGDSVFADQAGRWQMLQ